MVSVFLPTSRVFTSGYVNTETILHFFTVNTLSNNSKNINYLKFRTNAKQASGVFTWSYWQVLNDPRGTCSLTLWFSELR